MAPKAESRTVPGPAGDLEVLVEHPGPGAVNAVAIVCHPHPQFQGTMHNKVVHTLARGFRQVGIASVRFNFRGVGGSEGEYADGVGEVDDADAIVEWARTRWSTDSICLVGFSFGAVVVIRVAQRRELECLVTVAPPVGRLIEAEDWQPDCPWLIVQGDLDELVDYRQVVEWVNRLEPGPQLAMLAGVDHFFHGRLTLLRDTLLDFMESSVEIGSQATKV